MADVNLPSISELGQMQFLPAAQYQMARDNSKLANQFQQQNLSQGDANLQTTLLKNSFDEKNNPISLQNNQGVADKSTAEAILKRADADIRTKFLPDEIEAKRDAYVKAKSESQLAALYTKAETDYANPETPPAQREAAKEVMNRSMRELHERNKAKDALEKQKAEYDAKDNIADREIAGRADVANIMAGSREKVAGMKQKQQAGYSQALAGAKNPEHAANIAEAFAASSNDPTEIKYFQDEASRFRAAGIASKAAGAGVTATGKIDIPATAATGVVTNQANPVPPVPAPTARPGGFVPGARADLQQTSGNVVSPAQQRDANDAALEVKQREFANAIARGDIKAAQSLQKELEASAQGKGPLNSGGVSPQAAANNPQPTVRDDGKVNVVRPDGKAGWISKADLAEALKNGWKTK